MLEIFFASLPPYFELEIKLSEKLVSIKIEEAIEVLRSNNKNIDGILSDFSELGKIIWSILQIRITCSIFLLKSSVI